MVHFACFITGPWNRAVRCRAHCQPKPNSAISRPGFNGYNWCSPNYYFPLSWRPSFILTFAKLTYRLSSMKRIKCSSSYRYFAPKSGRVSERVVSEGGPSVFYRCRRRDRRSDKGSVYFYGSIVCLVVVSRQWRR